METRVRKLETEVAVLGNRADALEADVSMIKEAIEANTKKVARAEGLIIATVVIMQSIGIFLGG